MARVRVNFVFVCIVACLCVCVRVCTHVCVCACVGTPLELSEEKLVQGSAPQALQPVPPIVFLVVECPVERRERSVCVETCVRDCVCSACQCVCAHVCVRLSGKPFTGPFSPDAEARATNSLPRSGKSR